MIIIKGRSNCEWTSNAKLLCEIEQLDHTVVDLNLLENKQDIDNLKADGVELPAIYSNTTLIGNYQALQAWINHSKEEEASWHNL